MGQLGVAMRAWCAVAIVCVSSGSVRAGTVTMQNGISGTGFTSVSPDDFGTWGFLIGQQFDDEFAPEGVSTTDFTPTYLTGVELYITTANNRTSSLILTDYRFWHDLVENPPPSPDGIAADPMHTGFARTITSPIAMTGPYEATSAFRVATDAQAGIQLDAALVTRLSWDTTEVTSQVDSIYTLANNGTVPVSLVFHLAWDPDLYFNGSNQESDDVVGAVPGLCGVYQYDGKTGWGVALGSGPMSTVPLTYYFGGKEGFTPGTGPTFTPISAVAEEQHIWLNHGLPTEWQNYVVGAGKNTVGESSPMLIGDATIGTEYRFSLAVGATETIHIRRYYGTTTVPCFVSANCGNGKLDSGEACDGTDTATCNGATCTPSVCGDGYMNALAGELCDSAGVDSADCNGATCTVPMCGDGHVNVASGEECEAGELCEASTCTFAFSVGGGCAGCAAGGESDLSWLLACGALGLMLRRRARR